MEAAPKIYSCRTYEGTYLPGFGRERLEAIISLGFDTVHGLPENGWEEARDLGLRILADLKVDAGPSPPETEKRLQDRIVSLSEKGAGAFWFGNLQELPASSWTSVLRQLRAEHPGVWRCADGLGRAVADLSRLQGAGFDFVLSSVGWWDGAAPWFLEQLPSLSRVARTIGFPVTPYGASPERRVFDYAKAALLSSGVMLRRDEEIGIEHAIGAVNRLKAARPTLGDGPKTLRFTPAQNPVAGLVTTAAGSNPVVIFFNFGAGDGAANPDPAVALLPPETGDLQEVELFRPLEPWTPPEILIPGYGIRAFEAVARPAEGNGPTLDAKAGAAPSRMAIEHVRPELDGGQFPVKRVVGDPLVVSADIFRDGHDKIAARLWLREGGGSTWREASFRDIGNDRWEAQIVLTQAGAAAFVIEAWTDRFQSWRDEVRKKRAAGQALAVELEEGRAMVEAAARRSVGSVRARLEEALARSRDPSLGQDRVSDILLSEVLGLWMAGAPDRTGAGHSQERGVRVERLRARFSSWYEMFPRSQGRDPAHASTFREAAARFPEVRQLGFDVVYFVPIHPIGEKGRKGRNNSLHAEAGEPGSPYAIGSRLGGHTEIDPALGTLADFRELVRKAGEHGLEVALDFAVQCAPDHPWVTAHPNWFQRRGDGSIKFAENPPKKYEDIVNVDFEQADWKGLWEHLRDAVTFWVKEGVRIFRVDNPHTKPFAFWDWLIREIQAETPEVIFLAEAFTRPKVMLHLAKAGFTQSYTYFTWRNTKSEITEYLMELTTGESVECLRPNFFPTTPDILPFFLQQGGRAAFRIRLVLAATLSPSYGIYSGFELCENEALPGKEEYQDSEKYQVRVRDWERPGNIKDDIRRLNALRGQVPALQRLDNLQFHPSGHPEVLFYSKGRPGERGRVFVAVTVNPAQRVESDIVFPLGELAGPGDRFTTEELFSNWRQEWVGGSHRVALDPFIQPALVWTTL